MIKVPNINLTKNLLEIFLIDHFIIIRNHHNFSRNVKFSIIRTGINLENKRNFK